MRKPEGKLFLSFSLFPLIETNRSHKEVSKRGKKRNRENQRAKLFLSFSLFLLLKQTVRTEKFQKEGRKENEKTRGVNSFSPFLFSPIETTVRTRELLSTINKNIQR
jgi:hypothetical protein